MTRAAGTSESRTTIFAYTPSRKLAAKTLPDLTTLCYLYSPEGYLRRLSSLDGCLSHVFEYNNNGVWIKATDELNHVEVIRELDLFGNVICEKFSTGPQIDTSYDLFDRPISKHISGVGTIQYSYDPLHLKSITRLKEGEELYTHSYTEYDLSGHLLKEEQPNTLGEIRHSYFPTGHVRHIVGPYFSEQYQYDVCDRLIKKESDDSAWNYDYDPLSQLTKEISNDQLYEYEYDALYNRIQKNGQTSSINHLNELLNQGEVSCKYDLNGNLIEKCKQNEILQFAYDPLNRLVKVVTPEYKIDFVYDPLGRRLSKTVEQQNSDNQWIQTLQENYLYDGMEEIGTVGAQGNQKQFRLLGNSIAPGMAATVAVELEGKSFATCCDPQGNIRSLVDISTQETAADYQFTGFGEMLKAQGPYAANNPWSYHNKRMDSETGLIYFGHRYYDSELARWLSTDPEGFVDSMNLYQFLMNDPYCYVDPDGRIAWMIAIPLFTWGAAGFGVTLTAISAVTVLEAAGYVAGACILGSVVQKAGAVVLNGITADLDTGIPESVQEDTADDTSTEDKRKKIKTTPNTIEELVTLEEAKAGAGDEILKDKINDPRYKGTWKKIEHVHELHDKTKIIVHYWEHKVTQERKEFKIKDKEEQLKGRK